MAISLDADVIIGGEKKTFDLETWLDQNSSEEFAIASITVAELWHGVERAKTAKQRAAMENFEMCQKKGHFSLIATKTAFRRILSGFYPAEAQLAATLRHTQDSR